MSKLFKRLASAIGFLLLLLLVAAIAIPYFYKSELLTYLKEDINKNINATADFTDVHLSLFKSFPKFYFSIDDLSIVGKDDFEGIPLLTSKEIAFSLDLMSVIRKEENIKIHSIELNEPKIDIRIRPNGQANYDIMLAEEAGSSTQTTSSEDFNFTLDLEEYAINNGSFSYRDQPTGLIVNSSGLNHSGTGAFTASTFDVDTKTAIDELSVAQTGISYLSKDQIKMNLKLGVDTKTSTYTIKENELWVNALKLIIQGSIQQKGNGYALDISTTAPSNQFKELLSLLPGAYSKDFAQVNADGTFSLATDVKGLYDGDKNQFPNIGLQLKIDDGQFQYPGMGEGISKLFANLNIVGNLGNVDAMKIEARKFNFVINNEPFNSNFTLGNVVSNPAMKGNLKGKIDLGFIGKNFPMESIQKLAGIIDTDLTIDANYQELENGPIDGITLFGTAKISGLVYDVTELPAFQMQSATVDFSPKSVKINNLVGKYGKSDFKGNASLDNFLAIIIPGKTMSGNFNITSNLMDLDEIIGYEEESKSTSTVVVTNDAPTPIFDRFDLTIKAAINQLKYDIYPIRDFQFDGNIKPNNLVINSTKGFLGTSDFAVQGELTDVFRYLFEDGELAGKINFGSKSFDLNEYMSFAEEGATNAKAISDDEEFPPVILPERTNIAIKAKVKKLTYTNLNFTNVSGDVLLKDQVASLRNTKLNGLGGTMLVDGEYDSSEEGQPKFDLNYEMIKVDFGKVFSQLNTWKKLAPLGEYLTGDFSTKLKFSGNLQDGYYPDISTLTADGFLQTLNATLKAFKPIEKVANTLNIKEFKSLRIKNTKNWFELKDGNMIVKDFDYSYKGIDMIIGGSHNLVEDMNYKIKAKIPRAMIQNNKVGQLANQGISFLEKKAAQAGFNLNQGDFLNVLIKLGGSMKAPTVKVDILGTGGTSSLKDQVVNTVKETVTEKVKEVKEEVVQQVDNTKAQLKAKMNKEIATVMSAAKNNAQKIRNAGKKAGVEAKKLGYAQADKLVKEAGNNIFKKKAAELAAKKIKKETDKKVTQIEAEANKKADAAMSVADKRVADIKKRYNGL